MGQVLHGSARTTEAVRRAIRHCHANGWPGGRPDTIGRGMPPISYARHHFPPEVIRHAVWLYVRFTLSYRDVEELLAERGIETSYETVRRWVTKFGPPFARNLRRLRPKPTGTWHLDEMVILLRK